MEKFSDLKFDNISENFNYSDSDFYDYGDFINDLLLKLHSDRAVKIQEGSKTVTIYEAFGFEKTEMPGREFSVIGKVNTNKKLLNAMIAKFNIQDLRHLKNFVNKFQKDLFTEKGQFFDASRSFSVWNIIRSTEIIGEQNEDYVVECIKKVWGESTSPVREVTSSIKDMLEGIDITFTLDGKEKTCQVKPLKNADFKEMGVIHTKTSGTMKNYKTDFIAFVNIYRSYERCLFFKNENVRFSKVDKDIIVTIPYRNMIRIQNFDHRDVNKES
jgi:hypothetical protein